MSVWIHGCGSDLLSPVGRYTATASVRAVHRRSHIDRGCRREVGARTRFGRDVCAAEWGVGGVDAASGVTAHDARWSWPVLAALPRAAVLAFDGADTRSFRREVPLDVLIAGAEE